MKTKIQQITKVKRWGPKPPRFDQINPYNINRVLKVITPHWNKYKKLTYFTKYPLPSNFWYKITSATTLPLFHHHPLSAKLREFLVEPPPQLW